MSDLNSDLLTQEVDDEVRRERMLNLWKAYGKYLIGIAVGIVVLVAGNEGYKAYVKSVESAYSTAFEAAREASLEEGADALAIWEAALPELGSGYGVPARLHLASAAITAGDYPRALTAYETLAADSKAEPAMRDFATLQAGMLLAGKLEDADAARGQLSTIAVKGKAWYFSAQEQLALLDLQAGDLDAALNKFTLLADDAETPQSIQARASQFRNFVEAQQAAASPTVEVTPEGESVADEDSAEEGEAH
ncbi:tetratricopeptide repeat protein [Kordiimonas sp.]|uniref:tetratricopeptide repeat protein n=1 Tax=Kordiimonas sp. TaxID=1970157 RepID=UPI003A8E28E6